MRTLTIINKTELTKVEFTGTDNEVDEFFFNYNVENKVRIEKVERGDNFTTIEVVAR